MEAQLFAELIQRDLKAAVFNSDEEAIERFSLLISDKINKIEEVEKEQETTKSDIRLLIETVKQGFEEVNKRFESIDKRFESVDKRFEDLYRYMDKRFEQMQHNMDKRFEAMQHNMDKRFEAIDKRFEMMFKFMGLGFTVIALLIVVFKFIH